MRLAIEFLAPLCYKKEVTYVLGGKKKEEIVSDQGSPIGRLAKVRMVSKGERKA